MLYRWHLEKCVMHIDTKSPFQERKQTMLLLQFRSSQLWSSIIIETEASSTCRDIYLSASLNRLVDQLSDQNHNGEWCIKTKPPLLPAHITVFTALIVSFESDLRFTFGSGCSRRIRCVQEILQDGKNPEAKPAPHLQMLIAGINLYLVTRQMTWAHNHCVNLMQFSKQINLGKVPPGSFSFRCKDSNVIESRCASSFCI